MHFVNQSTCVLSWRKPSNCSMFRRSSSSDVKWTLKRFCWALEKLCDLHASLLSEIFWDASAMDSFLFCFCSSMACTERLLSYDWMKLETNERKDRFCAESSLAEKLKSIKTVPSFQQSWLSSCSRRTALAESPWRNELPTDNPAKSFGLQSSTGWPVASPFLNPVPLRSSDWSQVPAADLILPKFAITSVFSPCSTDTTAWPLKWSVNISPAWFIPEV